MKKILFLILATNLCAAPILFDSISNNVPPNAMTLSAMGQHELDEALMLSCQMERTNWIAYLLKNGANPNTSHPMRAFGTSPLQLACNRSSKEAVRLLINAGATNYAWNKIHIAAILNLTNEIAAVVQQGGDLDEVDSSGRSPIVYAFNFRNAPAIGMLVSAGAKHRYRPLQLSVIVNDLEKVSNLSRDPREINGRNGVVDLTPLMLAAIFERPEACKILITNGAEVETQASSRGTALILAVENGSRKTLQELLTAGADPNHVMGGKYSPLTYAVWKGDLLAARKLLDAGANPDLSLGDGLSARDFAKKSRSPEIQELFAEVQKQK